MEDGDCETVFANLRGRGLFCSSLGLPWMAKCHFLFHHGIEDKIDVGKLINVLGLK